MPFAVNFYNFSKRSNSTKRPLGASAKTVYVQLKDATSILNPSLTLRLQTEADFKYNYAYIPKFERYYFVNNKNFMSDNIVEVDLSVDVLASYKYDIQSTTAFVIYDTTSNSKHIVDKRIETQRNATVNSSLFSGTSPFVTETGYYVLTVVGKQGTGSYEVASITLNSIIQGLKAYSENIFSDLNEVNDLLRYQNITEFAGGNAIQCIRSCIWHPFKRNAGGLTALWLGDYDTGYQGRPVPFAPLTGSLVANIPWNYSDWRNMSPYTEVYVYLPYVGIINLSASDLQGCSKISINWSVECRTGMIAFKMMSDTGQILGTYSADAHVDIPVGINAMNPANIATAIANKANNAISYDQSMASSITSLLSANVGGAVGGFINATGNQLKGQISNAAANISLLTPTATCIGGMGGGAPSGLTQDPWIFCVSHNTVVAPSSVTEIMGTPECEVKSLSTLTGYVQTQGAEVASEKATNTEINSINSLLDGGIYIE